MGVVVWPLVEETYDHMRGRVKYGFGAKAPSLDCDSHIIRYLDCSGFVRYVLAKGSSQRLTIPDGSVNQHDWIAGRGLHRLVHYSDVTYAAHDPSRWFMCFLEPLPIGHVWLVNAGWTRESHGGVGVSSREWHTEVLLNCHAAYEVTPL